MRPSMADREPYFETLLEMHEVCETRQIVFVPEITSLIELWIETAEANPHTKSPTAKIKEKPVLNSSEMVAFTPTRREAAQQARKPDRTLEPGCVVSSGPPPEAKRARRSVRGPSIDDMLALESGQHIAIDLEQIKLKESAMRQRIGQANRTLREREARHHIEGYVAITGKFIVVREPGPPRAVRQKGTSS